MPAIFPPTSLTRHHRELYRPPIDHKEEVEFLTNGESAMERVQTRSRGFTLIELLITLAILSLIAGSLTPALLHAARQKRTVADIRNTGTAMFSWLTDQVGAAAAGQAMTLVDVRDYPPIEAPDLATILVSSYLQELPILDGWENPYEYYLNVEQPLERNVMAIRSPGRDGLWEANGYTVTKFDPSDSDQDILWADGFFVRWPQK